jgi:phosphatidylglycerophosphatase A
LREKLRNSGGFRRCFLVFFASDPLTLEARGVYSAPWRPAPLPRRQLLSAAPPPTAVPTEAVIETPENVQETHLPPNRVALFLATAGGVGFAPLAPGTFGSAVGVVLFPFVSGLGLWLLLLTTLALLSVGIWAADEAERVYQTKDDGRIVVDEVVGQWITLMPLAVLGRSWDPLWLAVGFFVFRGFDIWKPGPVLWAERNFKGGAGVMLDDVVAGIFGAGLMTVLLWALA